MPAMNWAYCTGSGWSSPSWARRRAKSSFCASGGSSNATGSPVTRSTTKTTVETPISTITAPTSRRARNRPTGLGRFPGAGDDDPLVGARRHRDRLADLDRLGQHERRGHLHRDAEAVREAGVLEQRLRPIGVVGVRLELRVVAEEGGRDQRRLAPGVAAERELDDVVDVDRVVDRLADAPVLQ